MIMSKQIQLSKGKFAIVDDEDFEYLNQWKWYVNSNGYAVRSENFKTESGVISSRTIRMHRVIMQAPSTHEVDHRFGNRLDNRKASLRVCTRSENNMNKPLLLRNSTGLKGVIAHKASGKWVAQIKSNKTTYYLGFFEDKYEAAKAYNEAALKYHGEFANLNQIPE
jgi:hypothetical protein